MDASQGWFGEVGITAVGKRFADSANTTVLPAYQRWDARAGYCQKTWDATLAVENLSDRRYYVSATSSAQIMPGNPRQLLLSTRYRF
jgi:iron complex outermembrane receptor protein